MKAKLKPSKELIFVRSEIARINSAYASGFKNFDSGFQNYVIKKLKDLRTKEKALMESLGYV